MKKLPASFELLSHTINIVPRKDLYDDCECYGRWTQQFMKIEIDTKATLSLQWHTLYHEIIHAVLDLTGYGKDSENETFVDALGGALAQVTATLK